MTISFANYLKEYHDTDVSNATEILKERKEKKAAIVKAAFDDQFCSRETALYKIEHEFMDVRIAPQSIDQDFLKENMNEIVEDINNMTEGEIRIIINNDVQKGNGAAALPMEKAKVEPKRRGRPAKKIDGEEPVKAEPMSEKPAGEYAGKKVKSGGKWYVASEQQDEDAKYLYAIDEDGSEKLVRMSNIEEIDESIDQEIDEAKKKKKKKDDEEDISDLLDLDVEVDADDKKDDDDKEDDDGVEAIDLDVKDDDKKDDDDKEDDDDEKEKEDDDDEASDDKKSSDGDGPEDDNEDDDDDTTEALKWSDISFEKVIDDKEDTLEEPAVDDAEVEISNEDADDKKDGEMFYDIDDSNQLIYDKNGVVRVHILKDGDREVDVKSSPYIGKSIDQVKKMRNEEEIVESDEEMFEKYVKGDNFKSKDGKLEYRVRKKDDEWAAKAYVNGKYDEDKTSYEGNDPEAKESATGTAKAAIAKYDKKPYDLKESEEDDYWDAEAEKYYAQIENEDKEFFEFLSKRLKKVGDQVAPAPVFGSDPFLYYYVEKDGTIWEKSEDGRFPTSMVLTDNGVVSKKNDKKNPDKK